MKFFTVKNDIFYCQKKNVFYVKNILTSKKTNDIIKNNKTIFTVKFWRCLCLNKDNKKRTTSKKQKFIRNKTLLDPETGEIIPMQEVQVEDRDFNFHKVWLEHFLNSLDGISNQKMRLAFWILDNLTRDNLLVMTQQAIAKKSGMSESTVARTMKALQESEPPFLVKINSGAYQVNPDIIWKGTHSNRMGVCFTYNDVQRERQLSLQDLQEDNEDEDEDT